MTELLKALIVNKTYTSLRTPVLWGEAISEWSRSPVRPDQAAPSLALITMTMIFRHFLIMPQKFGENSRNNEFPDILKVWVKEIKFRYSVSGQLPVSSGIKKTMP